MTRLVWGCDTPPAPSVESTDSSSKGAETPSMNSHVFFYKDVDQATISDLNSKILTTRNSLSKTALDTGVAGLVLPIHLHIHSYGGSVLAGFAGSGIIAQNHVHTHIEGGAASAATFLSVCGAHRTITQASFILIHQLEAGFWGKHDEIPEWHKNMDRFMKTATDIYTRHTKLPKAKLQGILKHDVWFTPEEALKYGLVDEII